MIFENSTRRLGAEKSLLFVVAVRLVVMGNPRKLAFDFRNFIAIS